MNFAPQKFFIGLIDFFSILLLGTLLTYLLDGRGGIGPAGGLLCHARRCASLGRLPLRELSLRPPGLLGRLLAGRVLRLGPALYAARPPSTLARPRPDLAGV